MSHTTLKEDGYAATLLTLLAQSGAMQRKAISQCVFRETAEGVEDCKANASLTRAASRLLHRDPPLIKKERLDKKVCLTLTRNGWKYINDNRLAKCPVLERLSVDNVRDLRTLERNARGIHFCRSMQFLTLAVEKPSFSAFAASLGSKTHFYSSDDDCCYMENSEPAALLSVGVFYTTLEIRAAYKNSSNAGIEKKHSRSLGYLFREDGVYVVFGMEKKTEALFPRIEASFESVILSDVEDGYAELLGRPPQHNVLLAVRSTAFLPTFFHGCLDGVERDRQGRTNESDPWEESGIARMQMKAFALHDHVYMAPSNIVDLGERLAFARHAPEDDNAIIDAYSRSYPKDNTLKIAVACPDLCALRKALSANTRVTAIGPSTAYETDLISRCLRTKLTRYVSMETMEEVPFRRYSSTGKPLIGNSDHIDYEAPLRVPSKNDPFFDNTSKRPMGKGKTSRCRGQEG